MRAWTIEGARIEANRLRVLIDNGTDPRELDRLEESAQRAKAASEAVEAVTVGEAWSAYVENRRPRWGDLHYRDHIAKVKPGGQDAPRGSRGTGKTAAGPLYPLMQLKLRQLTPTVICAWATKESEKRPTVTRLCWRLLRGFLNWCAEQEQYSPVLPAQNPAKAKIVREVLGKPKAQAGLIAARTASRVVRRCAPACQSDSGGIPASIAADRSAAR